MSKYFDKLVKMNESLTKELKDKGLFVEDANEDEISIPKDALTDDQKKDILVDKGVDQKTVDNMKDADEISSALDATLNNDQVKKESSGGAVYLRIDDDDLDLHGYVAEFDGEQVHLTDNELDAIEYGSAEEAEAQIRMICDKCHYDPATFTTQNVDSQTEDNGENWVSIDSSNPSATVIP